MSMTGDFSMAKVYGHTVILKKKDKNKTKHFPRTVVENERSK